MKIASRISAILLLTLMCISIVSCSRKAVVEMPVHSIDVAEDLPSQVKRIQGMGYSEVIERFGQPDFSYYYPAPDTESKDTIIVPVMTATWLLDNSPLVAAQEILDELVSEENEMSGFCSADLIVNFKSENNGFTAIQATLE